MITIILFEMLIIGSMFFLSEIWIITKEQHILSLGVVLLTMVLYQISKKIYTTGKNNPYNKEKFISHQTPINIGIDMLITIGLGIGVVVTLSQIVFIPMYIMENSIALIMGILFYTLAIEGIFILPYTLFRQIIFKKFFVAVRLK